MGKHENYKGKEKIKEGFCYIYHIADFRYEICSKVNLKKWQFHKILKILSQAKIIKYNTRRVYSKIDFSEVLERP